MSKVRGPVKLSREKIRGTRSSGVNLGRVV